MMAVAVVNGDISPQFRWNPKDAAIARELLKYEATPQAVIRFSQLCDALTDYSYWFLLGTLWVGYTGWSDLQLWKRLFSSRRPNRELSLMKPSELAIFRRLPDKLTVYRAHRPGETDWIAYTLDPQIAGRFARERGVDAVSEYTLRRRDVTALFLRRSEAEVLMLNSEWARKRAVIPVIVGDGPP